MNRYESKKPDKRWYKTTNWREYNKALKARGSLSVWLDTDMQWLAPPTGKRGRRPTFSDAAIQSCLSIKCLFGLALRQALGFVHSLLRLAGLQWPVPDYSTLSRRLQTLKVQLPYRPSTTVLDLLVDSTGIKFLGEGEWKRKKRGAEYRRQWRKVHLGIDAQTIYHFWSVDAQKQQDEADFPNTLKGVGLNVSQIAYHPTFFTMHTNRSSFTVTLSVWYALILREALSRLFHRRAAWAWLLLEPVFHIGFMAVVFTVFRVKTIGGIDTVIWLVLGYLGFFLFRRTATQSSNAINSNRPLFSYRQVKPVDTVIVRALVESLLMLSVSAVILAVVGFLDHFVVPAKPLVVIQATLGLWLLGMGLGLVVSVVKELIEEIGNLIEMLMTPLYLISGIILHLSSVPPFYREWLMLNPVAHGVEALRLGFADYYHAVPELSLLYLHGSALGLIFFGLALHVRFQQNLVAQ